MLVGITGYAQAGKDELAKSLRLRAGFWHMGMSDALLKMALVLDPILPYEDGTLFQFSQVVGRLGYTESKNIPSVRAYMQRLGTEAVRDIIGENSWVQAAERKFVPLLEEGVNVAVTGVRFASEANMIKRYGGVIVRIEREGFGPVNAHASDQLDDVPCDVVVFNNGTLQDLASSAQKLITETLRL